MNFCADPIEKIVNICQLQAVCNKQNEFMAEMEYIDVETFWIHKEVYECLIFQ